MTDPMALAGRPLTLRRHYNLHSPFSLRFQNASVWAPKVVQVWTTFTNLTPQTEYRNCGAHTNLTPQKPITFGVQFWNISGYKKWPKSNLKNNQKVFRISFAKKSSFNIEFWNFLDLKQGNFSNQKWSRLLKNGSRLAPVCKSIIFSN